MTPEKLPYPVVSRCLNGIEIEFAVAGECGRDAVILLHGFPDLWQGWHYQIGALAEAAYRVLIPNQRGYGHSSKPSAVSAYDIDILAADVIALADSEGHSTFNLVGHDWGGIVAWWVAARFPARVDRLVILNAPHPGAFPKYLLRSPTQICRSWYVGFFQLPWIPELVLAAGDYSLLFEAMTFSSRAGIFDESDRHYLVDGWSQPHALTGMLNYYRAAMRRSPRSLTKRITKPTLVLFGKDDPTEEPGLAEASMEFCDDARLIWLDRSRHWIQREEAQRVNDEMLRFLSPI